MNSFHLLDNFRQAFKHGSFTQQVIETIEQAQPFGLGFGHIFHSFRASSLIGGFAGKHILEMGGALPDQYVFEVLNARTWTAVEHHEYIGNQHKSSSHPKYSYNSVGWVEFFKIWRESSASQFDIIYSIAAFEHIDDLPGCLMSLHAMLRDGGILYAYFTPIWSAHDGSHGFQPQELDTLGTHSHLLFDFTSIQDFLISHHGATKEYALNSANALYKNSQINRLSYEDYIQIFNDSDFKKKQITALGAMRFDSIYSNSKLSRIKIFYPNMQFSCDGFEVLMFK